MDTPERTSIGVACGATAMTFVGSSVAVSHALVDAPLFLAQALRYAAAALLLLAFVRVRRLPLHRPRGTEWAWLAALAATGLVLFNVAVVRGTAHAEPAVIAVAVACVPVLLGVLGPLLQRTTPRRRTLVAAVVVTVGAVLVEGTGRTDAVGVAWAVVALGCEAAFTLLAVPVLPRHGPWGVSVHSVWMGAVMFGVLGLVSEGPGAVGQLTGADVAALAYLAVGVTAVAFVLWYSAVALLGPARTGLLAGVSPIAAAVAGTIGGMRVPGPGVWAGIAVVLAGLAVGFAGGRPGRRPSGGRFALTPTPQAARRAGAIDSDGSPHRHVGAAERVMCVGAPTGLARGGWVGATFPSSASGSKGFGRVVKR